jgi:protein ImuA
LKALSFLDKANILRNLQPDILRLQGFKSSGNPTFDMGLGLIKDAFPNGSFPLGAVHEFFADRVEDSDSTGGFISGLLSSQMGNAGTTLWISSSRTLFPPA